MKKIAVIGSLNVDYVATVTSHPAVGETILSSHFEMVPGGKGANQAYALGRMGADVGMFGMVGLDDNGTLELDNLAKAKVNTLGVERVSSPTGIALITVNQVGDNSIVVVPGANSDVDDAFLARQQAALENYDIFIFQLEIPLQTVINAIRILKTQGKLIVLDPAPAQGPLPKEMLEQVDFIKPNETEIAMLTGLDHQPEKACQALLKQGVGCVLASMGGQGVLVATPSSTVAYSSQKVHAVDTTAAGDGFIAAFCYALSRERSVEDAVIFANKVAAIVVQRHGAQTSIPSKSEIQELWS